jgi:heme/copper-type cytochrome/quinol oxidase subunit 2
MYGLWYHSGAKTDKATYMASCISGSVISNSNVMKKALFTILWMFIFFIVGLVIFAVFSFVMVQSSPRPTDAASLNNHEVWLIMLVDWLFPIGLPIFALIMSIRGVLPGTRSKKPSLDSSEQAKQA